MASKTELQMLAYTPDSEHSASRCEYLIHEIYNMDKNKHSSDKSVIIKCIGFPNT